MPQTSIHQPIIADSDTYADGRKKTKVREKGRVGKEGRNVYSVRKRLLEVDKSQKADEDANTNTLDVYQFQTPDSENIRQAEEFTSPKFVLSRSVSKVNEMNESVVVQLDDRSKLNSRRSSLFDPPQEPFKDILPGKTNVVAKGTERLPKPELIIALKHSDKALPLKHNNNTASEEQHDTEGSAQYGNIDREDGNYYTNGEDVYSDNMDNTNNDSNNGTNEASSMNNSGNEGNRNGNGSGNGNGEDEDNEDRRQTNNIQEKQNNNPKPTQALVQKLQDIYKSIVKQEVELQERCSQLTTSQTTDLNSLWSIYKINVELVNNYVTFISTALLSSQSQYDLIVGQEIVETYRIGRRLWVYGTITFLDVLKNFSNFMDPEVCSQFITHVFISLSTMLTDIPTKYSIPWMQRLGDLSRMAIALYPSGFIDWKLSSEYWYNQAMKYTYGYGKLYYHMSTIQQNTLEAFVNLGKSVFCQDTFIPSQQYMQLVIDNIYQRAFIERGTNNSRNTQLIEYLKHSEVMLLPNFVGNDNLQKVVINYFQEKFGTDVNDINIFRPRDIFLQSAEYLVYFFKHAPAFAESHILQTVGFGEPKNPFAILFELPKYLKEKKDKKDRKKIKSARQNLPNDSVMSVDDDTMGSIVSTEEYFVNLDSLNLPFYLPTKSEVWIKSLAFLNSTAVHCSIIVLQKFLRGPFFVALPHLIPWMYFIIAVCQKSEKLPQEAGRYFWRTFLRHLMPWNSIVSFLNVLIAYALDNEYDSEMISNLSEEYDAMKLQELLDYFNTNEELPEVWKCWGSLWYDSICDKSHIDPEDFSNIGVKDHLFFDAPLDGIVFDSADECGEKFWKRAIRTIFTFKKLAEDFDIGVILSSTAPVYCRRDDIELNHVLGSFSFKIQSSFGTSNEDWNDIDTAIQMYVPYSEIPSDVNTNIDATPPMSVQENENIFEYAGYKKIGPELLNFDKNGELRSGSNYTTWYSAQESMSKPAGSPENSIAGSSPGRSYQSQETEDNIFTMLTTGDDEVSPLLDGLKLEVTNFVLDATSWLRHSAHIYKLATNRFLTFAVCLTTFQELRFLRKSKDENVMEAATRAIIIIRQLYSENKVVPLRFTGNIATHIEEHLEFEEQITWRSHVDEFVIESISKAQKRFQHPFIHNDFNTESKYFVLITDDDNMKRKAQEKDIKTFTTRFVFSLCSEMGKGRSTCTN
ncbi:hypothetical protein RNJ44_01233 [Nakaseomyces bracarensis]|uniref:PIN domain-containing protein n=1 Tax=Nakaseomyces bracarensis TaxID=273131 RepID=A0ABR4NRB2_9SACH